MPALIYLVYLLAATLYPFEFAAGSWDSLRQGLVGFFEPSDARDFALNLVLFAPLGTILFRPLMRSRSRRAAIAAAAGIGALASLSIEFLQVFVHRDPSLFDVIANSLGAGAGALARALWPARAAEAGWRLWGRLERGGAILALAAAYSAIPLILSLAQSAVPFGVWNPRYTLQLGNELTLDRPWLGKLHFVALYNRALGKEEVRRRHRQGPDNPRPAEGVVSLYRFDEGKGKIVRDRSGVPPAADLSFDPSDRVRWLRQSNGIEIVRPAVLTSGEPVRKLAAAVRATGELSIEAWVTPRDTQQRGPARIVSFSRHGGARNFTLGQDGDEVEFRLRTPVSGVNDLPMALSSGKGITAAEMTHVVATYRSGIEKLFINGGERPATLNLTQEAIVGLGTGRHLPAVAAYGFVYFFPAAFFASGFFAGRFRRPVALMLLPAAVPGVLLLAAELFQVVAFARAVDLRLIGLGILAAVLGALGAAKQRRMI